MRVTIDVSRVEARVHEAWGKALYALSTEILADCNEYCKADQHTLRNSSMIHSRPQEGRLIWQTPYARRQYWEIQTALTPGTCWKWCEAAKARRSARWQDLAQRGLRMFL